MIEKHYSINEISEQLNMSFERTRQLVKDEPGVLRFPPESTSAQRRSRSIVPNTLERHAAIVRRSRSGRIEQRGGGRRGLGGQG
jgi:hypothetical protein